MQYGEPACSEMQHAAKPCIPPPRLCHLVRCPKTGYGFSLTTLAGRPGQYVARVEEGSPAQGAGLVDGDRVVEVNGVNVNQENHKQVVNRIKLVDDETKLLVADKECDQHHQKKGIILKSSLPYVVSLSSLSNNSPSAGENRLEVKDKRKVFHNVWLISAAQ